MPTYSYACTECGNRFDVVQSFTDDTLTTCDRCSGRLRKLFSPVGVVFKGSGFYHNDSRAARKAAGNGSGNGSGHSDRDGHAKSTGSGDHSGSDKSGESTTSSSATSDKTSSSSDSTTAAVPSGASG